jgi:hypothetical protein
MRSRITNALGLVVGLSLILAGNLAYAKFYRGMSSMQVSQEVTVQLMRGVDITSISREAHEAGIKSEQVAAVLIRSGQDPLVVVSTLIRLDQSAAAMITAAALACKPKRTAEIMAAAIAVAPQQRDTIVAKALTVPMINPTEVLGATAAGVESGAGSR